MPLYNDIIFNDSRRRSWDTAFRTFDNMLQRWSRDTPFQTDGNNIRRLRQFVNRIESLAARPAPARLAARLLELAWEQGAKGEFADRVVLPSSKSDLARTLGMTPETFSRLLKKLEKRGQFNWDGKSIRLAPEFWDPF